jgi:shikimate dehydrogenase
MPLPISGRTALVGVLGDPVRHSLSPAMHNAALAELGLEWAYLALPAPAADLATVVRGLEAMGCRGLSVTIPHKQAVAELCRERSPLAQRVGAVNTLVPLDGGGWMGTNTDVEGFMAPLRHGPWQGKRALVLGCGGSARAVVAGLVELGFGAITVAARRPEALAAFAQTCGPWAPQLTPLAWGDLDSATDTALAHSSLRQADLVVNTTPIGMASAPDPAGAMDPAALKACPLNPAQLDQLGPGATVYDLIYTPRPTQLLREAARRGCPTQDGLEMLVQQGAAALRLWSGLETVPTDAMRTAVEAALA